MKLSKKKVFALALVVCLIATLSLGSLAWFTDSDSVDNKFQFADSETSNPNDIFSVDVWEDLDGDGDMDDTDGHTYEDVLPGDKLKKIVHVENTGNYDEYIRVTVTISDASVWQKIYNTADVVPLTTMVGDLKVDGLYAMRSYVDTASNSMVYVMYYEDTLAVGDDFVVFESVNIPTQMTVEHAASMNALFNIDVKAEAVQTRNVGDDVIEAFRTVTGNVIVDTAWVNTVAELAEAITYNGMEEIVVTAALTVDGNVALSPANAVTVNANGMGDAFTVVSGGKLTLGEKISVISDSAIVYANGGEVVIDGATLSCSGNDTLGYADNGGTILVKDGTVTALQNVLSANGGEILIQGGTVRTLADKAAVHVRNSSTLTVEGGLIEGDVGVRSGSVATIANGTVNGVLAVYDGGNAAATITGGSFLGQVYTSGNDVTLTISGGRFAYEPAGKYLAAGYVAEGSNTGPGAAWYFVKTN